MRALCISTITKDSKNKLKVSIPTRREDRFKVGDYVKIIKIDEGEDDGDSIN